MLNGISDLIGAQTDRLRCEICQNLNLSLSPINTGLLRPAVATVLTVHGIETHTIFEVLFHQLRGCNSAYRLRYAPKGARQQRSNATKPLVI